MNMKRILFMAVVGMLMCADAVYAQKTVKVQGTIDDSNVTQLYINVGKDGQYGMLNDEEVIEVKKGKFTYTAQVDHIVQAFLKRESGNQGSRMNIFLVPGEKLDLTIKGNQYFYGGSRIYKEMNEADMFVSPLREEFDSFYDGILARYMKASDEEKAALKQAQTDSIEQKYTAMNQSIDQYRKSHMDAEGVQLFLSGQVSAETIYNDLLAHAGGDATFVQKNRVAYFLKEQVEYAQALREKQRKQAEEEQAKIDAMKGSPAADFTLNDLDGKPLSLSSLRGKYVILDFWGSWCGWCIKGIPDMKKYYEKYAGKFEILGVDCNDTEAAWKGAVKQYELPWLHVYNPRTSSVLKDYSIQGFPTKIIIDPEGKINKVIVGESPDFYTYLDELFGK